MPNLPPLVVLLSGAAVVAELVWAIKLWRAALVRRYPVLFTFLVFVAASSIGSHIIYRYYAGSVVYGWYWVVGQPLTWMLYFCLLVEIHNRMLAGFRGFERLGQVLIYVASGTVGVIFLAMTLLETSLEEWSQFWVLQERSIYIALTLFSLFLIFFALYFRLRVPRNVKVLFGAFTMIFASLAVVQVLGDIMGERGASVERLVRTALSLLCMACGTFAFSRAGEMEPAPVEIRQRLDPQAEADLANGLENLNDVLLRILRS